MLEGRAASGEAEEDGYENSGGEASLHVETIAIESRGGKCKAVLGVEGAGVDSGIMADTEERPAPLIPEGLVTEVLSGFRAHHPEAGIPKLFFAPGRVNLMGAHLDYSGGAVLPAAIDRGTLVAVAPRSDGKVHFSSSLQVGEHLFELARLPQVATGSWADYPLGVLRGLLSRSEVLPGGASLHFGGNLPIGAGLSSSASICVGTALALGEVWGLELEAIDHVQLALSAEREFVGVQCGIMDPYAVGLARAGTLLWLECGEVNYEYLPLDTSKVSIMVADTMVRRELATSEFNQRVDECRRAFELLKRGQPEARFLAEVNIETLSAHAEELGPVLSRRAGHVIAEVARTEVARAGLLAGEPEILGAKMLEAHASLRGLYEVSCPELDRLVEVAGGCDEVLGGRLTGAGFGGACVFLVERGGEERVGAELKQGFREVFDHDPEVAVFQAVGGPFELEA